LPIFRPWKVKSGVLPEWAPNPSSAFCGRAGDDVRSVPGVLWLRYAVDPSFQCESFQKWQSGFLVVFSPIYLPIFLRQKDSPQSRKADEPNSKTDT
jgi:hypothetical protein